MAHNGKPKSDHRHYFLPSSDNARTTIVLPSTYPGLWMLVMLVISLLVLLLDGMARLQLAMAVWPIGRINENHIQAAVWETKLLRQCNEWLGCLISSSKMKSWMISLKIPWLLLGYAIAGFGLVGWIFWRITLLIVSIVFAWLCVEKEQKSHSRWLNRSLHALLTM